MSFQKLRRPDWSPPVNSGPRVSGTAPLPVQPPAAPVPATAPTFRPAAGSGGFAVILLAFYIFLIYSRATELIALRIGNFRIALILCFILAVIAILNRRIFKILTHRVILCFFAFTFFLLLSVPTSVWRSESLRLILLQWPLPLACCICVAVLVTSLRDCLRITTAITLGVLFIVVLSFTSAGDILGRLGVSSGSALTLANPNFLALQLIMGLPFCLLAILRRGFFSFIGVGAFVLAGITTYVILATGSRSGLIAMLCGVVFLFLQGTGSVNVKLGLAGLVVVLLVMALLPGAVIDRYKTILSDSQHATTDELLAAVTSSAARRHHLEQSVELTIRNPLFGIGAGQFKVAAADLSKQNQERAAWLETHNTITQVSSEAGIPAAIAYTLALGFAFVDLFRVYRASRKRPELAGISALALTVLLSFGMTFVNANFTSIAYQLYLPLLCGISIAVTQAARRLMSGVEGPLMRPAPVASLYPPNVRLGAR